ncbi:MAG TPA: Spy/CpxP family protein refolding chaperone [Thermoanaerobaculia bacterium]|nr:Spy/CpxP family protein refolding chaperone [Thermoanaerobaculia bacterium]
MKKRIAIIAVILAAGVFAAVPFVNAEPGPGRGGHRGGFAGMAFFHHLDKVADELDLSDQQIDQIKAIFADLREQNAQYRDQMHGGMKAAAGTLLSNPNDLAGAQAQLDAQFAAEKAMKSNMLAATSKALNILTADQRAKLQQMVQERSERRAKRRR